MPWFALEVVWTSCHTFGGPLSLAAAIALDRRLTRFEKSLASNDACRIIEDVHGLLFTRQLSS